MCVRGRREEGCVRVRCCSVWMIMAGLFDNLWVSVCVGRGERREESHIHVTTHAYAHMHTHTQHTHTQDTW